MSLVSGHPCRCASFAGPSGWRYLDENFVEHDEEFHGLKAWVIQHEYDHIEGVVFTDRISPLRRNLLKGKLLNLAKGKYRAAYKTR